MPINSVDVQPRGYRILTGGSDNKGCIWNLLPIISRKYEIKGLDIPKKAAETQNDLKVNGNLGNSKNLANPDSSEKKLNDGSRIDIELDQTSIHVSITQISFILT